MSRTAGLVLAAGRSTRYRAAGGAASSKLLETSVTGEALLRSPVRAALGAGLAPVVVVTGHERRAIEAALADFPLLFVHNPEFATGLASSLRVGLAALDGDVSAVVVLLGDMPLVDAATVGILVAAARADPAADAVVPVSGGVRGNPVVLTRRLFGPAMRLVGDEGARRLLRDPAWRVREVVVDDDGVRRDMDEPGDVVRR